MATPPSASQVSNIYTTCYENFFVLSVSVAVNKHHLMLERQGQAPVLRYRDIRGDITFEFTPESLKESLIAVCPVLGVHNVARVFMRQGTLLLIELDFTQEKLLEKFCKSLSNGTYSCVIIILVTVLFTIA